MGSASLGNGRGSSFADGVAHRMPLQMGTLSKALGSYGGYLCASRAVIDLMHNRARTLIYSTGLPPASRRRRDRGARRDRARSRPGRAAARQGAALHRARRACRDAQSPIVPVVLGVGGGRARRLAPARRPKDSWSTAIRPPTVPEGTARLRLAFCAATSRRRDRAAGRASSAIARLGDERDLRHRDRHR